MVLPETHTAARHAGLTYVSPAGPGISRSKRNGSFSYRSASGGVIRSRPVLQRIARLAIPPAWTDVWISSNPRGHIQATGIDARGRRQYRYHADWTRHRNLAKFDTLHEFATALPSLRARINRDLRLPGLPRDKVAACVLHVMDRTLIRIGNSEYARDNKSYGLTTILNRHAHVAGATIQFRFKAKSGQLCETSVDSPRAARIVRICQDLPGQELFCYRDVTGRIRDLGSAEINSYLACCKGSAFTAKDFRTWGGTCAAAAAMHQLGPPEATITPSQLKKIELIAVRVAAAALGNTPAVCRKFYVHHLLLDAYASGRLNAAFARAAMSRRGQLSVCERAVLLLLQSPAVRRRSRPSSGGG